MWGQSLVISYLCRCNLRICRSHGLRDPRKIQYNGTWCQQQCGRSATSTIAGMRPCTSSGTGRASASFTTSFASMSLNPAELFSVACDRMLSSREPTCISIACCSAQEIFKQRQWSGVIEFLRSFKQTWTVFAVPKKTWMWGGLRILSEIIFHRFGCSGLLSKWDCSQISESMKISGRGVDLLVSILTNVGDRLRKAVVEKSHHSTFHVCLACLQNAGSRARKMLSDKTFEVLQTSNLLLCQLKVAYRLQQHWGFKVGNIQLLQPASAS